MARNISDESLSFRDAVCQDFRCGPEVYAETVFWHSLYPHAKGPAKAIRRRNPSYFDLDFELIERIASSKRSGEVKAAVECHFYHHPPTNLLRRLLRVRISGQRLIFLADRVFAQRRTHASGLLPAERANDPTQASKSKAA